MDVAKRLERAEKLYLERLAKTETGALDEADLDLLCAQNPDLELALREQHANCAWFEGMAENPAENDSQAGFVNLLGVDAVLQLAGAHEKEGRYTLLEEVASGGMGTIYKVWDAQLKRTLAMKVSGKRLKQSSSGGSHSNNRFLEEALGTGRLDHPGIVPVHDIGIDAAGCMYFTMPLVKGHNLKTAFELLRTGSEGWSLSRALGALIKVCETLGYAHSKGVIHRDIKPANIMVGRFGQTYVMDWGLARVVGHGEQEVHSAHNEAKDADPGHALEQPPGAGLQTKDGQVLGTPAYMPPEQARGELGLIGTRSDIYAVGAMLYHLLAGHAPYREKQTTSSSALLKALRAGAPKSLERAAHGAPAELIAIANKAMARKSSERYRTMEQLAAELRAYLEGRVVMAHRTGAAVELRKWIQRNRLTAGTIGIALLLSVLGAGALAGIQTSKNRQLNRSNQALEARGVQLENSNLRLTSERERADMAAYAARIAAAQASLQSNRVDIATGHLDACPAELRGWEWHHLRSRLDGSLATLRDSSSLVARTWGVAFSHDGSSLVSGNHAGRINGWLLPENLDRIAKPDSSMQAHGGWIRTLASAKSRGLLASGDAAGSLKLWSLDEQRLLWEQKPGGVIHDLVFDAHGQQLATASTDGMLHVWNTLDGALVHSIKAHQGHAEKVRFGPLGTQLFSLGSDSALRIWRLPSGQLKSESTVFNPRSETNLDKGLDISPDGRKLALGGANGSLRLVDSGSLKTTHFLHGHSSHVKTVAFSPDGTLLASSSRDHTMRVWNVQNGEMIYVARGHTESVLSVAWHPNGELLATCSEDGSVKLWDIGVASDVDYLDMGHGMAISVSIHPDGEQLLVGRNNGSLLVETKDGSVLSARAHSSTLESRTAIDPSGRYVVSVDGRTHKISVEDSQSQDGPLALAGHRGLISGIEFNASGSHLASSSHDGTVHVREVGSWETASILAPHKTHVYCVAFAPTAAEGQARLVSGTMDGLVRLWDPFNGALLREWQAHSEAVRSVEFSPDGSLLASCSEDRTIKIWRVTDWVELNTLAGHTSWVFDGTFSPDGTRIASCGTDMTVRLWDVNSGINVATLLGHRGWVTSLDFSSDGTWIASGSNDKSVRLWETKRPRRRMQALGTAMQRMSPHVDGLFEQHDSLQEILGALERDGELNTLEARAGRNLALMRGQR